MLNHVEVSRLLDILGNRNRRRIIELLRQKPCFVTEISDRLIISPKAVIDHLGLMEREALISSFLDERRRKYYYLSQEFDIVVSMRKNGSEMRVAGLPSADLRLIESLSMLRRMARARESILDTLENLEHDIEATMNDIIRMSQGVCDGDLDLDIIITLSHQDLTFGDLVEVMEKDPEVVNISLGRLGSRGIITKEGERYRIAGMYGAVQT